MKIIMAFCAIAFLMLEGEAIAAPGWSTPLTIASYLPTDTGLTIIASGGSSPVGCSNTTWYHMNLTDANFSLISSTILTAFSQQKTVKVWGVDCGSASSTHFVAAWIDR